MGGSSGLQSVFSANAPEHCTLANQTLVISPGHYTFQYAYQTTGIPPSKGIRWEIVIPGSDRVLAQSPSLSSEAP